MRPLTAVRDDGGDGTSTDSADAATEERHDADLLEAVVVATGCATTCAGGEAGGEAGGRQDGLRGHCFGREE